MSLPSRLFAALLGALAIQAHAADESVVLYAEQISGADPAHWSAQGNVEVHYQGRTLYADQVDYDRNDNQIVARGNVKLVAPGLITEAPEARVWVDQDRGIVLSPRYQLADRQAQGKAEKAEQLGPGEYRLTEGDYSSCPGPNPAWRIQARNILLDQKKEKITVRSGRLEFFSLPVAYLPILSFPTSDRATGFLAPSFGSSDINGAIVSAPFYWNIAPNQDATITPRLLSQRGVQLQTEYRYLGETSSGVGHLDVLPGDKLTGETVYAGDLRHQKQYGKGVSTALDLHYVSYPNYLSDFGGVTSGNLPLGNLPYLASSARLDYVGDKVTAGVALRGYQELAQSSINPYQQLPQAFVQGYWPLEKGFYGRIYSDFNYFLRSEGVIGQRFHNVPRFGWRVERPYGSFGAELGAYATHYQLQRTDSGLDHNVDRVLPLASLRGGLVFERDLGRRLTQTIEPEFRYTYIPARDQSDIPLFDTDVRQLSYPILFADNLYAGADRINAANRVTLGLSSSILNPNGRELLRAAVGQIRNFDDRQVDLAGQVVDDREQSDYFALLRWQPRQDLRLFSEAQYDPKASRMSRYNLGAQYQPGARRVLNLSYRYSRDLVDQVVLSGQMPLGRRWEALASYRYSLRDDSALEQLLGLGYDGGCWATRLMVYDQIRLGGEKNSAIFFQILLRGLTNLGNQPTGVLTQMVPGAQMEF
ncbi:LPS-assembly protein LptD [Thermithiobacillus plumbiphilus]|uniref:LPS-assembly protein LptD n=1 Tax=Thermithiobacillus plumbiphilus TaxID=1729899 RepID=A0ABU9D8Y2_9PROT